jgi:hypothetical protein
MLDLAKSEIRVSRNRDVASGVTSLEEGVGLMAVRAGGILTVNRGAGAANTEEFAGVALHERQAPALMPIVIQSKVVLISTGLWGVVLSRAVVGTPRVTYVATGTALTVAGGAPAAGEYRIVGGTTVEVNSADLAKTIQITYTYTPTVADLMLLGGDNSPTTFASLPGIISVVGVIEQGLVYTSNFDPTINWDAWTPTIGLKVAANGIFTSAAGTGATVNGRVVQAPNVDSPFLGIDFSVL